MLLKRVLITIASGFLSVAALSANAVSYDSFYFQSKYNQGGIATRVMAPHANHFCFLTQVGMHNIDAGGEWAHCRVRRSGTVWLLEAILGENNDADVQCAAHCYNN